jgi:hypothetical protein
MPPRKSLFKALLEYWDTALLIIGSIAALLLSQFGLIAKEQTSAIILILVTAIAVHQIRSELHTDETLSTREEKHTKALEDTRSSIQGDIATLTSATNTTLQQYSDVRAAVLRFEMVLTQQYRCEASQVDQRNFYIRLTNAVEHAEHAIDLTQLDALPPEQYGIPEKMKYFALSNELVRTKPHIRFRRIVAIPNIDKLKWVREVLNSVKDCPNYNMHYVDIASERFFMPPLSLQLVDRRELCMVDPTRGFLTVAGQDRSLWIKSTDIVEVFAEYYEKFWTLTTPIKEGGVVYWDVLDKLETEIVGREQPPFPSDSAPEDVQGHKS